MTSTTRRELLVRGSGALLGAGLLSQLELGFPAGAAAGGLPSTPASIAFNAFHPAGGTYSTFTLGCPGASGGLATEATSPANQDVFIGAESADGSLRALPFFAAQSGDPAAIDFNALTRDYRLATDDWTVGELGFRILSPAGAIPEPGKAGGAELRDGLLPAVLARLTLDNRSGDKPRRAFFGIRLPSGATPSSSQITATGVPAPGFVLDDGQGRTIGVHCAEPGASAAAAADFQTALTASGTQGAVGLLRFEVPAGQKLSYRIAIAFWHAGTVAQGPGIAASNWYTKLFSDRDAVASHALTGYHRLAAVWEAENREVDEAELSSDQRFLLIHGARSYLGNTRVLAVGDRPMWMVLEGGYGGFNTCDLMVDLMLYEMRKNPWTVRNLLEWYLERYSYTDQTNAVLTQGPALPEVGTTVHDPTPHPGGISFTHDMGGTEGIFTPQGTSGYEHPGLSGVASYMTAEELTNWTLTALVYLAQTKDSAWATAHLDTLAQCLASLVNRDDSDPANRDGIMSMETDREGPNGLEITTYDALDPSLGQARHSSYLATKQWAAYVCLAKFFAAHAKPLLADQARVQARRVAGATVAAAKPLGYIPALLPADGEAANAAKAIPVIEGLVFALYGGAPEALEFDGEYGRYVAAMREHLNAVLKTGACLYDSGAWKLSSSSDISWLTTPMMHQHIARRILGRRWGSAGERCDAAFASWCTETEPSPSGALSRGADYWCFVEQFDDGRAWNSVYYPRGALGALWLEEDRSTARLEPKPLQRAPGSCRRHPLTIRLMPPRGQRIVTARAFVNGRHAKTVRGHALHQITLDIAPRRGRRTIVKIVARTNRGRTIRITRTYDSAGCKV